MKLLTLLLPFLSISSFSRIALYCFAYYSDQIAVDFNEVFSIFILGIINDLVTFIYISVPFFIIFTLSNLIKNNSIAKYFTYFLYIISIGILVFTSFAEFLFWDEFSSRFNFIAVDYLVYSTEVIGNIIESYPIKLLLCIVLIITLLIFRFFYQPILKSLTEQLIWKKWCKQFASLITLSIIAFKAYDHNYTDISNDRYINELNKNGIYNLFSAFRNNSLDYYQFYKTIPNEEAFKILRNELLQSNQKYLSANQNNIERRVTYKNKVKKHNIVMIVVESLSHEYIGMKREDSGSITPFLDQFKNESLNFTNFFATGTRTVRGLEALTLSIPPTPGSSIVRRPGNENLFSIASILKPLNYEMQFIYGGYGYFDNMNYFFANNGFKVIDRGNMDSNEITFSNVWGVSDENLLDKALKEADKAIEQNKPFFQFIMTTSNHRPFTFPDNKIDLPSKSGRNAAVKYTDFALGEFIKKAKEKKWFENTIFIITADHCASTKGKTQIPMQKYHIPLFIYAPKILSPKNIDIAASQIDLPPTILGLLNISYNSNFFGNDIFYKNNDNLFMGTYQLLGFYQKDKLAILGPKKDNKSFRTNNFIETDQKILDNNFMDKAISYYLIPSYMFKNNLLKNKNDSNN